MSSPAETSKLCSETGQPQTPPPPGVPLVIDLDGTLVNTDLLLESLFVLVKQNPLSLFAVPFWLAKGRAYLKRRISQRVTLDVSVLPYHHELLEYVKAQRARGRRIILATGTDEQIAGRVADHLRLFDAVLASDGIVNLSGSRKRDRLVCEFGQRNFDYAGNDRKDLPVWSSARKGVLVNAKKSVFRQAVHLTEIEQVFDGTGEKGLRIWVEALRLNQWLKNLLVFVPLITAHCLFDCDLAIKALLAFLAFGLCASSTYLLNDLLDLSADRHHPRKRQRPFASGRLSPGLGLISSPLLLGLSVLVSLLLPLSFLGMLLVYYGLSLTYSVSLKQIVLLDVIVLAGLYTARMMAGSASVAIWPSPWLLAFSTFLFLSLALVKRYAELAGIRGAGEDKVGGRGYRVADRDLLPSLGSGSGYVAVLVLAIYISSGEAEIHYTRDQLIWLLCPLLLYWISYIWLTAHRGEMHDDPLVFTVRDRVSRTLIFLSWLIMLLAR